MGWCIFLSFPPLGACPPRPRYVYTHAHVILDAECCMHTFDNTSISSYRFRIAYHFSQITHTFLRIVCVICDMKCMCNTGYEIGASVVRL